MIRAGKAGNDLLTQKSEIFENFEIFFNFVKNISHGERLLFGSFVIIDDHLKPVLDQKLNKCRKNIIFKNYF